MKSFLLFMASAFLITQSALNCQEMKVSFRIFSFNSSTISSFTIKQFMAGNGKEHRFIRRNDDWYKDGISFKNRNVIIQILKDIENLQTENFIEPVIIQSEISWRLELEGDKQYILEIMAEQNDFYICGCPDHKKPFKIQKQKIDKILSLLEN